MICNMHIYKNIQTYQQILCRKWFQTRGKRGGGEGEKCSQPPPYVVVLKKYFCIQIAENQWKYNLTVSCR